MSALDYVVLIVSMLGIAGYGIWRTRRQHRPPRHLSKRQQNLTRWFAIGLSVMATQASAITFLSTPGQGYAGGLGFVQIYFGVPLALLIIAIFFLPIFRKLNVFTAYEYLGKRFDAKTRLLGAALFLVQRGLGAGLTIYAPAIVLTTVFGWPLSLTIICSGLLVIIYTVAGGNDAVTVTQKYQLGIIFAGMFTAVFILLARLPQGLGFGGCVSYRGSNGQTPGRGFFAQSRPALYTLDRLVWRTIPFTFLFRHRPIAGTALHRRRRIAGRTFGIDVQCAAQSPHAVFHFAAGRIVVCFLPVPARTRFL